ncbi:helix-turn-helix domain-containing protein [Streptomyces sp. NPDC059092]|uniref:transcriptional regulator n=1 Tax=Streptomyces sp. NPDC059092 TaxID=3346725 RepID=UPI0036CAFBBF
MTERVPDATRSGRTDEFAARLRELKDRSGLSYGALAKRLHMSTSTLHRYCNGTAVPHGYAPVESLARVCRATPQELVELHRHWILADAARGGRPEQVAAAGVAEVAEEGDAGDADDRAGDPAPAMRPGSAPTPGSGPTSSSAAVPPASTPESAGAASVRRQGTDGEPVVVDPLVADPASVDPVVVDVPREPAPSRRGRTALIASSAAAAVLGAVVLAVNVPFGGGAKAAGGERPAGATAPATGPAGATEPSTADSTTPSPSGKSPGPSVSASATASGGVSPSASKGGDKGGAAEPGRGGADEPAGDSTAAPLNVAVNPYYYEDPCSQHFLVDSEPEQVGPPAYEPEAPHWAAVYGAVSSGVQRVALTVQGSGRGTVVLKELHVRVVTKRAPLAWNDYEMGNGCGGGVETKSFDIDLDKGSPTVTVKGGQRDFPYKVSESDPEVFYITARVKAHDVRWDLSLDWSSGGRSGTVHINDDGKPFRTSARTGRPEYIYPLGGSEWIKNEQ